MSLVHLRLLTWSPYQREGWEQNQPEPAKISDPPSSYDVPDCTVMKKVTIFALLNLPVLALDLPEKDFSECPNQKSIPTVKFLVQN